MNFAICRVTSIAPFTRAIFVRQFLCDEFYLLVYMRTFARILCDKYICRKTSLPVFMWQTKIVNYKYLFVYMTRHIFVACIYLHVCQALCDYNIVLKTNFLRRVEKYLLYHLHEQSFCHGKLSNKNCSCKRGLFLGATCNSIVDTDLKTYRYIIK